MLYRKIERTIEPKSNSLMAVIHLVLFWIIIKKENPINIMWIGLTILSY